jgi:hypothetical protein
VIATTICFIIVPLHFLSECAACNPQNRAQPNRITFAPLGHSSQLPRISSLTK